MPDAHESCKIAPSQPHNCSRFIVYSTCRRRSARGDLIFPRKGYRSGSPGAVRESALPREGAFPGPKRPLCKPKNVLTQTTRQSRPTAASSRLVQWTQRAAPGYSNFPGKVIVTGMEQEIGVFRELHRNWGSQVLSAGQNPLLKIHRRSGAPSLLGPLLPIRFLPRYSAWSASTGFTDAALLAGR